MPLAKGSSSKTISKNIAEFHTGKTYAHTAEKFGTERANKQAVAVALETARKSRAIGGPMANAGQSPWFVRQEARNMMHTGPISSVVPGRTDNHAMNVPSGSHVLPADHVSSLGQGNTAAGFKILSQMFPHSGPYGSSVMPIKHGAGAPRMGIKMPHMKFSEGGERDGRGVGEPTPVNTAGGEFVVSPQDIIARYGNLKRGHEILDNWIISNRKQHIRTLSKLPGPAKT